MRHVHSRPGFPFLLASFQIRNVRVQIVVELGKEFLTQLADFGDDRVFSHGDSSINSAGVHRTEVAAMCAASAFHPSPEC
jgi:hypothetical protein